MSAAEFRDVEAAQAARDALVDATLGDVTGRVLDILHDVQARQGGRAAAIAALAAILTGAGFCRDALGDGVAENLGPQLDRMMRRRLDRAWTGARL